LGVDLWVEVMNHGLLSDRYFFLPGGPVNGFQGESKGADGIELPSIVLNFSNFFLSGFVFPFSQFTIVISLTLIFFARST
jgi:hypothetical protein